MSTTVSGRIVQETTRSGQENVIVDGFPYHSRYNPEREARQFLAAYPLEEADVVIVFGWGLGYAGAALSSRLGPRAAVVVLEPDPEIFSMFLRHSNAAAVRNDTRFRFVVGPDVNGFFDTSGFDPSETSRYLWIDWPAAEEIYPLRNVRERFNARLRDRAGNLLTHFQNGTLYFQNAVRNLRCAADPSVGTLFGRFAGVPLVLVSAGPSLDRNIRDLKGIGHGSLILSVDTALGPLLRAGIFPHVVVIADPTPLNARHIERILPPETFLVAEQAVDPEAMESARRRFQFGVGVFPDGLYREFGVRRERLDVWGSVATAALDLAIRTGANPIVFAGQDFSFSWGRDYASGTIFDGRAYHRQAGDILEKDLWGFEVPTTADLVAYRDWFRRKTADAGPTRFINATEGGILTGERIEILSLREALGRSGRSATDILGRLADCHREGRQEIPGGVEALLRHLSDVMSSGASDCGCRGGIVELIAKEGLVRRDDAAVEDALASARSFLEAARDGIATGV